LSSDFGELLLERNRAISVPSFIAKKCKINFNSIMPLSLQRPYDHAKRETFGWLRQQTREAGLDRKIRLAQLKGKHREPRTHHFLVHPEFPYHPDFGDILETRFSRDEVRRIRCIYLSQIQSIIQQAKHVAIIPSPGSIRWPLKVSHLPQIPSRDPSTY